MDRRQKSALRARSMTLADQLIMDEDLFGALKQNKVFSESMLHIIKEIKKPKAQVYKLLELLEKRGPKAFEKFVEILDENYDWLADDLRDTYEQKMQESETKLKTKCELTPRHATVRVAPVPRMDLKGSLQSSYPVPVRASLGSVRSVDLESNRDYPDNGGEPILEDTPVSDRMLENHDEFEVSDHESEPDIPMDDDEYQIDMPVPEATVEEDDAAMDEATYNPTQEDNSDAEIKSSAKTYKDQCLSPINIIGATPKTANANCSPIQDLSIDVGEDMPDGFVDVQDEVAIDIQDETEGNNSQASEGVLVKFPEDSDEERTDDELAPSEVFYDKMRRKSGLLDIDLSAMNLVAEDHSKSESPNDSFCKLEEENEIREIYVKCYRGVIYNSEVKDIETKERLIEARLKQIETSGITFTMINDQVDELVRLIDDKKRIIDKALTMFENRDKKLSLVLCIDKEKEEKSQLKERLMEEIRKVNEMANDMYQHSQDMKGLEKLKNRSGMLERENDALKGKCAQLEQDRADIQRELDRTKRDLDSMMVSSDDKRLGKKVAPRRTNSITTSPRRGSSYQTTRLYQQYNHSQSPRTPAGLVQPWRTTPLTKK